MIAIHERGDSFTNRWVEYCQNNNIDYILVDCYSNSIISELKRKNIKALFWHHSHMKSKDIICAQNILSSLRHYDIVTFPNFFMDWHFDDKIAQKYLADTFEMPFVRSYVYYDKNEALEFVKKCNLPIVAKLKGGSGSRNVRLLKNHVVAQKYIKKAFKRGFKNYSPLDNLKERIRKYRNGVGTFKSVLAGIYRFIVPVGYSTIMGREKGYVYFQEFIPDNLYDIRIIVIDKKAFAIKRMVRKNDFRASGGGSIIYDHTQIPLEMIKISFEVCEELKFECMTFDFVLKNGKTPLIVEFSYGFQAAGYDKCQGFWDEELNWYKTDFNPYGWMIEKVLNDIETNA